MIVYCRLPLPMCMVLPVPLLMLIPALARVPMQALTLLPYNSRIGVERTCRTNLVGISVAMLLETFRIEWIRGARGTDPVSCGNILLFLETRAVLQLVYDEWGRLKSCWCLVQEAVVLGLGLRNMRWRLKVVMS